MTKEEQLKEEAENKLDEWSDPDMGCEEGYCYSEVADFMFRFAEPREKQIADLEKELAELKNRDCWKSCEYANPKSELIGQHIKDIQALTKAKEIIKQLLDSCFGYNSKTVNYEVKVKAEQFLKEIEK